VPCQVNDSGDGQYHVIYSVDRPCAVSIKICFKDEYGDWVPVRGSPYCASFCEETPGKMNPLIGPSLNKYAIAQIEGLQNFMRETLEGVNITEKDLNDVRTLLNVKDHVEIVTTRNDEIMLQLD
jgi:hypothetical protein